MQDFATFPLFLCFNALRQQATYAPGIDDYYCLLSVLEQDPDRYFNAQDPERKALLQLCQLLWLKPDHNVKSFEKVFAESHRQMQISIEQIEREIDQQLREKKSIGKAGGESTKEGDKSKQPEGDKTPDKPDSTTPKADPKSNLSTGAGKGAETELPEQLPPLYLNFQEGKGEQKGESSKADRSFLFVQNFVPFQYRHFMQIGRFLRGDSTEKRTDTTKIQFDATLKKLCKEGYLLEPVYAKQAVRRQKMLIFIDYKGSMVAFKHLANAIAYSMQLAGIDNHVYYFRNVPQHYHNDPNDALYVYENAAQTKHCTIKSILEQHPKTPILIVSDAGTASGSYNMNRIEATETFLRLLYQYSLKVVWLNPMPQNRWDGSSAYIIRELCDMFEATPDGLKHALPILRGKKAPRSPIVFPELLNEL